MTTEILISEGGNHLNINAFARQRLEHARCDSGGCASQPTIDTFATPVSDDLGPIPEAAAYAL
jgi:hypothetical protein